MTICISETESWGGGSGEKGHLYFMDRTGVQNGNFERRGGGRTNAVLGKGTGEKRHLNFMSTGEQKRYLRGVGSIGEQEKHRKTNFRFLWNRGTG